MNSEILLPIVVLIVCWNLFLHLKLSRESWQRRELAIAFRQHLVERRQATGVHFA